jgi:hypothetical protein
MFRPILWPSYERFVTKDGYIEVLETFVEQCTDVTYIPLHAFVGLATLSNC